MIHKNAKKTLLFDELKVSKIFDYSNRKFIHEIDNVYFTVSIKNDSVENKQIGLLVDDLIALKKKAVEENKEFMLFNDVYMTSRNFGMYTLCLTKNDSYDIFIAQQKELPNKDTPRILVQVRSKPLWLNGYKETIDDIMLILQELLKHHYNLDINELKENRIDYAFHTNYIQNPERYFSDDMMKKSLIFQGKYHKVGNFTRSNGVGAMTVDYLALGSRNANNVFVRQYNKTREVIEKGYKSYFIEIWKDNKMINEFDYYCIAYAYNKRSYESLHEARLKYYIEFGKDTIIKENFKTMILNKKPYGEMKIAAKGIVPAVTLIMNIEFETKRKFYRTCDSFINTFKGSTNRIIKLLDNRSIFLEYLTHHFVCWGEVYEYIEDGKKKKDIKYLDWWDTLRKVKINNSGTKLKRNYDNNLDEERLFKSMLSKIASVAVVNETNHEDLFEDILDIMSNVNDNHKENYLPEKEKKHKYYKYKLPNSLRS